VHTSAPEFFDLAADPDEQHDVLDTRDDLERYRSGIDRAASGEALAREDGADIDEELRSDIRALGYAGMGYDEDLPHPLAGSVPGVANPLRFSRTPIAHERAPPLLGADTDDVLRELLGMQPSSLAELRRQGVIL
jgi:hypothetical protein